MLAWVVIYRRQHRLAHKPKAIRLFRSGLIHSFPSFLTSLHHYLLTSCFPYLLPSSVSCNSFVCHSYENCRGVYQQFPFWNSPIKSPVQLTCWTISDPYPLSSHTLAHSFALFCTQQKLNSFLFKRFRTLCSTYVGWGTHPSSF